MLINRRIKPGNKRYASLESSEACFLRPYPRRSRILIRRGFTSLMVAMVAIIIMGPGNASGFLQSTLQDAYERHVSAVCVMTFTQEITDPRTGEPKRQEGHAVALIVSPEGLLLSNGHLQLDNVHSFNFRVLVRLDKAEREYPAVMLEKPDDVNITVLRIQSETPLNLPFVRFKRGSQLALGEELAVVGVMGETMDFERSLVVDRITAVLDAPRRTYCLASALRLGYVTGPVINTRGETVGIAGFDLSRAEGGDIHARSGHPLVYQTDLFIRYIDAPPDVVEALPPSDEAWLGVFTQPLKEEYAEYWALPEAGGLIVSTVVPDSPAAEAGLRPGDIIRAFDGRPIRAIHDRDVMTFTKLVRDSAPHKVVEIEYLREGEPNAALVVLGQRPRTARDAEEFEDSTLGLVVREITRDLRILLNLGEDVNGVIVRRVISGSPAHQARMQPGVIILSLGDHPTSSLQEYERAMQDIAATQPAEVSLFARVGPVTGFFRLRPRW